MKFQIISREGFIEKKKKYLREIFEQIPESSCEDETCGYLEKWPWLKNVFSKFRNPEVEMGPVWLRNSKVFTLAGIEWAEDC